MPLQQINNPIFRVMLPVLTQMNGEPERYRQTFLRILAQILLITLPGIAFMVGTADLVIPILLGRQWSGASPILAALGLASFLQVLNNPTGWLFLSQNRTREFLCWGIFGSATSVISISAGLSYGPLGVAMAYAASEYIPHAHPVVVCNEARAHRRSRRCSDGTAASFRCDSLARRRLRRASAVAHGAVPGSWRLFGRFLLGYRGGARGVHPRTRNHW